MKGCLVKGGTVLIAGGFTLLIGGYFFTKSYLRSEEFMSLVQYGVSQKLGGHVTVAETEWDGWTLENEKLEVLAGKGFQDLEVERVSVELNPRGFMQRVWKVADVHVRDLSLHLGDPLKETPAYVPQEFPVTFTWKDLWKAWLPRKVEVEQARVEQCQGSFLSKGVSGHWNNAELFIEREHKDFLFTVPRGEVHFTPLSEVDWQIQALKGRIKPTSFFLNEGTLMGNGQALLSLSGEGDYHGKSVFQGELKDLPLETLLKEDWKKRAQGALQASFTIKTTPNAVSSQGKGRVENGLITALPALDTLAKHTGISRFRHILLDTCTFHFRSNKDTLFLENITLLSKDFLQATGTVQSNGETGKGTLEVGIHASTLSKMPKGTEAVFKREKEGFFWTEVNLTQQKGKWKDDLTPRLMSAVMKGFFSAAPEVTNTLLDGVKNLLDADGKSSSETPSKENSSHQEILKKGTDLIETGVNSLFDLLGK